MKRKSYERNRRLIGQTHPKYDKRRQRMSISVTQKDFLKFEEVRESGTYNMFDPQAREMTDLSKEQWFTIMRDYDKLKKAWTNEPPVITGDKDTDSLLEDERTNNEINEK